MSRFVTFLMIVFLVGLTAIGILSPVSSPEPRLFDSILIFLTLGFSTVGILFVLYGQGEILWNQKKILGGQRRILEIWRLMDDGDSFEEAFVRAGDLEESGL